MSSSAEEKLYSERQSRLADLRRQMALALEVGLKLRKEHEPIGDNNLERITGEPEAHDNIFNSLKQDVSNAELEFYEASIGWLKTFTNEPQKLADFRDELLKEIDGLRHKSGVWTKRINMALELKNEALVKSATFERDCCEQRVAKIESLLSSI